MKMLLLFMLQAITAISQPPAGKIVYSARTGDNRYQLYVINSDGTGRQQLTNFTASCDLPDVFQSNIVFRQVTSDQQTSINLLHSGNGNSIDTLTTDKLICYPRWSPDGSLIAYEYYPGTSQDIWIMDMRGDHNRPLVKNARHPCWSSDGSKILFTRDYEVYQMDFKSHAETRLTYVTLKDIWAKYPALSPDGKLLAFVGYSNNKTALYIMNLKKDEPPLIIENCFMPRWTDNPLYLVCSCKTQPGKGSQIVIINAATGQKTTVTNDMDADFPCWVSSVR